MGTGAAARAGRRGIAKLSVRLGKAAIGRSPRSNILPNARNQNEPPRRKVCPGSGAVLSNVKIDLRTWAESIPLGRARHSHMAEEDPVTFRE
jgi:hypothetical protein